MFALKDVVPIPALIGKQESVRSSPARFKLDNAGRRSGKTVKALHMGVLGHGAPVDTPQPFKGLVDGLDIVWIAPTYPQSNIIWTSEIRPRFRGAQGVRLNEAEHTVTLPNNATLWLRSAEAIEGIRGIGKRLGGVIGDEAAHFDLEPALKDVILPALLDNHGWLLLNSTPKAGSYFNQLCEETISGGRSEEWAYFHATPFDNPRLHAEDIETLIAEYPQESEALKQEVYAELLKGGAGLAFPNWEALVHCVSDLRVPQHWMWLAGLDWGITAPSVLLLAAVSPEKRCLIAREWVWRDKDAYEAGFDVGTAWLMGDLPGWPTNIWADSAMDAKTGIGGTTLLMDFQSGLGDALKQSRAPSIPVLPAPKGPGSRVSGYNSLRKMLDWGPRLPPTATTEERNAARQAAKERLVKGEKIPGSWHPQIKIVKEHCPYLSKVLPVIRLDEKKQDQIDTKSPDDHPVDALRYLLAGAWPDVPEPVRIIPVDQHPGFLRSGKRRSRDRSPEIVMREEMEDMMHELAASGREVGGRYGPLAR